MHKPVFSKEPDHTRGESIVAMSFVIALHVAVLLLLLTDGGPDGSESMGTHSGEGAFEVDFVGADNTARTNLMAKQLQTNLIPRKARANAASSSVRLIDSVLEATDPLGTQSADKSKEMTSNANDGVDALTLLASAPASGGAAQGDSNDLYLKAIKQAITAKWMVLHPDAAVPNCSLTIEQTVGGLVTSTLAGDCLVDSTQRRALEAAALMAQPLPYAGFEQRFATSLRVAF